MKIAIMQPYFFPYIGYFKLVNKIDKFVFYSDVNYIKNGWINRNRIIHNDSFIYVTVPLRKASSFAKINTIVVENSIKWREKISRQISNSYMKAPYFNNIMPIIMEIIYEDALTIAEISKKSVINICKYLNINKEFIDSDVYKNTNLNSVNRILDICKKENAEEYWNLPGGKGIYNPKDFSEINCQFELIKSDEIKYIQFGNNFIASLSIIDVLMFNSAKQIENYILKDSFS